jgi:hypothetical protein
MVCILHNPSLSIYKSETDSRPRMDGWMERWMDEKKMDGKSQVHHYQVGIIANHCLLINE